MKDLETKGLTNHSRIILAPILYGHAAIDFIKCKILEIISNPYLVKSYDYFIGEVLWLCQYTVKRIEYSKENEIRLLVFLPAIKRESYQNVELIKGDLEHIYLKISKETLSGLSPYPRNTVQETISFREFLRGNKYSAVD